MDIVSHSLWGGVALGRKGQFKIAAVLSILPDILAEGIMFTMGFLGFPGMPDLSGPHPKLHDFPVYAQNFYNVTHSLVVFAVVFLIVWLALKRPPVLLLAWALHILIDIPTHSFELFPTPFLWPLSDFKIDGIGWRSPVIMIPNIIMLLIAYSVWQAPKFRRRKG